MQVNDVCGDDVEELSVVGYHYERLLPSLQILLPRMHTMVSQKGISTGTSFPCIGLAASILLQCMQVHSGVERDARHIR